jgi:hypothetical protein
MPKKQKNNKEPNWQESEAGTLLETDLISGEIPLQSGKSGMSPQDVYLQRPEFTEFSYEYFRDRLQTLRAQVRETVRIAKFDSMAILNDRTIYPTSAHNHHGEPQ